MEKKNKLTILFVLFLFLIILLISRNFSLGDITNPNYLKSLITTDMELNPIKFILLYFLATIFFVPSYFMSLNSGILFGICEGFLYSVIGIALASTIGFGISRLFSKSFLDDLIKRKYPQLYDLDLLIEKKGFLTVFFLRILPIPFNLVNLFMGVTKVKFKDYIFATLLTMIPEAFLVIFFGNIFFDFKLIKFLFFIFLLFLLYLLRKKLKKCGHFSDCRQYFKK